MPSRSCAINCRYCFRRHFDYQQNVLGQQSWSLWHDYINADPSIKEIILSGGDPLVATDVYLAKLIEQLQAIPHLTTLRIHTRLPIVLPERICEQLLNWLAKCRLQVVIVIHCNHGNEINQAVIDGLNKLRDS